jgi:hypothetical protein
LQEEKDKKIIEIYTTKKDIYLVIKLVRKIDKTKQLNQPCQGTQKTADGMHSL